MDTLNEELFLNNFEKPILSKKNNELISDEEAFTFNKFQPKVKSQFYDIRLSNPIN